MGWSHSLASHPEILCLDDNGALGFSATCLALHEVGARLFFRFLDHGLSKVLVRIWEDLQAIPERPWALGKEICIMIE
jgi:hypothetical protein